MNLDFAGGTGAVVVRSKLMLKAIQAGDNRVLATQVIDWRMRGAQDGAARLAALVGGLERVPAAGTGFSQPDAIQPQGIDT